MKNRFRIFVIIPGMVLAALLFMGGGQPIGEAPVKADAATLKRGKLIFNGVCATCHGKDGSGDGPLAANLLIKPRDFTQGLFKNRSTATGQLPTDYDIYRNVTSGIHNSAMPPFQTFAAADRWAVVQYVKTFSKRFDDPNEYPLTVLTMGTPTPSTAQSLARGRDVYVKVQCWKCHGASGEGNGPSANTLKDEWGHKTRAVDLTNVSDYHFATNVMDVFRIFSTGLNGTPMPSFQDVLSESERWDLANYVWSLSHDDEYQDGRTLQQISTP